MAEKKQSAHLVVTKPVSLLERDLKVDFGSLFKALAQSVAHFGTGQVWEAGSDLAEAATAVGLKADPGGLAWRLIQRSLLRAMRYLADEAWLRRPEGGKDPSDELTTRLDRELAATTLEINSHFFRRPGELALLGLCENWFKTWLVEVGFHDQKASSIAQRLRTHFVYSINQEWRSRPEAYAPILLAKDTPFVAAGEREQSWEFYRAWMLQELDRSMFGEPFSLRQLYVPLRAYYVRVKKSPMDEMVAANDASKREERIAIRCTDHLLEWIKQGDRDDSVRVISGGPGSGKSSLARMLTTAIGTHTSWRAIYVPLHRINYKGEIVSAVEDYLRRANLLPGNPKPFDKEEGEERLVVVFDGLDELAMLGRLAQETASQFVRAVKDMVRDFNTTQLRVRAILTGRTVIMQSLESEFRTEGAVLHLCPYYVPVLHKETYVKGWNVLKEDQRQVWWKNYGTLSGLGYAGLPSHFGRNELAEVSSEPLLNFLLALADQTKTVDFSKRVTQNQIYSSLVHELYGRRWADGENFALKGMTEDRFHRVLEEIAVAAWHGDGRKTTVGEIKQHCRDSGIMLMLETFQEGAESGVLRLLTAFFFRQSGVRDDENAFEFTHKSFGEYLVARRVVRMASMMEKKVLEQESEFTGWDERKCLEEWARLCGPSPMTERQFEFVCNEVLAYPEKVVTWQGLFAKLIGKMLRQGLPMERLGISDFLGMRAQARNAEESLLLMLNACARASGRMSKLDWPDRTSAGSWLKFLQGQRRGPANALAMDALSWLSLSGQCLDMADLYGANLEHSNLAGIDAHAACLSAARLSGAKLDGAVLNWANLGGARLHGASLRKIKNAHSNWRGARLSGARVEGARVHEISDDVATIESLRKDQELSREIADELQLQREEELKVQRIDQNR